MAADDKDAEETTVLENEVQEGEPVIIRMPVDIRSVTLTVIATLGGILVLQYAKPVFIPVILGTLISYVLGPAVTSMAKHGIPRVVGVLSRHRRPMRHARATGCTPCRTRPSTSSTTCPQRRRSCATG